VFSESEQEAVSEYVSSESEWPSDMDLDDYFFGTDSSEYSDAEYDEEQAFYDPLYNNQDSWSYQTDW
jgi:hypothetical protein